MLIVRMHRPDVVARALGLDGLGLVARAGRRCHEQFVETLVAIANRLAIDFEHVAELQPALVVGQLHHQHVRTQLPELARLPSAARDVDWTFWR